MAKIKTAPKKTDENLRAKEEQLTFRLSGVLYKQIQDYCGSNNLKVGDGIRQLIELGLKSM